MPSLVRSPEQIFRAEKKDIFVIHSTEDDYQGADLAPGLRMIAEWLQAEFPKMEIERVGASEYSGYIVGGDAGGLLRVDFGPDELKRFCDRWEINDASIDSRFQTYIYSYQSWLKKYGSFVPTLDRPAELKATVWWFTPQGFIHHQVEDSEMEDGTHPAAYTPQDIWFHVPDLWPEIACCNIEQLTSGYIECIEGQWRASMLPPWGYPGSPGLSVPTADEVRDWFNLPSDSMVRELPGF